MSKRYMGRIITAWVLLAVLVVVGRLLAKDVI